jgi:hypothetical protein
MKDIFEYINKLDKNGYYKLADKLENELRIVCAQGLYGPAVGPASNDPAYRNYLQNRMMLNESREVQLRPDTDTLSPETYNRDQVLEMKKNNDRDGRLSIIERKLKSNQPSVDLIPGLVDMNKSQTDMLDENSNDIMNINNSFKTLQEKMNVNIKQPVPQQ